MLHKLQPVVLAGKQLLCPNCRWILKKVDYPDALIYVCVNTTCEWILGPDTQVKSYLNSLKETEKADCVFCKKPILKSTGGSWIHTSTGSSLCVLYAAPPNKQNPSEELCRWCDRGIELIQGAWKHSDGFVGCARPWYGGSAAPKIKEVK